MLKKVRKVIKSIADNENTQTLLLVAIYYALGYKVGSMVKGSKH